MNRESRDAAFSEFVRARRTHLRRIAYAICGDWHRADDLVQTALVKLYVAWPRLEREGRVEAYVRTIIVRADVDEHRRPWRRERAGLPDVDQPAMQRRVVVLRHWLGLSVEETAHELRISQGTVKSHSSRGLAALREVLARQ